MELTRLAAETAAFLFNVSLRSLLLFFAVGLVLLFLRRASAASRHLLWAMTVGSLLLLPVLCACLPRWDAPVLPSRATASLKTAANIQHVPIAPLQKPLLTVPEAARGSLPSAALDKTSGSAEEAEAEAQETSTLHRLASQTKVPVADPKASRPAPLHSQPSAPAKSASSPAWSVSAAEWLVSLWLIGVLFTLCRIAFSLLVTRRLIRGSRLVTEGALVEAAREGCSRLSLSTPLIIKAGTAVMPVAVPMTFGAVRPVVLMPMEAAAWPAERLRVVLLHEAAHVKRLDWMTTMLTQVVCALYWFHPLVWLAARRLRVESEQACDDLVLGNGVEAVEYADHLVEIVRGLAGRRVSSAVVTMAYSQEVTGRLKTILAASKNRTAATRRGLALAILAALVFVLPLAAVRPTVAAGSADKASADKAEAKTPPQTDALPSPQVITFPGDTRTPKQISDWQRINQWRRTLLASRTSPWKATLPDGTCVYLTSLWALNEANAEQTWTPSGTLLSDGGGGSLPSYKHFRSTFCNVDVILVFPSDTARRQTRVAFGSTEKGPSYGTDLAAFEKNGLYVGSRRFINTGFQYVFPPTQKKASLAVSLAMGPETVLVSGSPLSGAATHLATGETIVLTKAELLPKSSMAQVQFSLPSRFVRNQSEYRIAALDKEGLPLPIPGGSQSYPAFRGKNATVRYAFQASKLPLDRIKEFRFSYRPSQTVVFRNVALRPVAASAQLPSQPVLPLPTAPKPFDFDQTTWAQTAGDAGLKLVAVSDKPANTKRWWRPDGTPFLYDWHQFRVNFEPQNPHVPTAFVQQTPVLIFRSGHPSTSDFSIDGWRDPQAFRPNGHVTLAEYVCLDQNGTSYFGFTPLLVSNTRSISVRMRVGAGSWQVQDTREVVFPPARPTQDRRTQNVQQITGNNAVASWTVHQTSSTRTEINLRQPRGISGRQVRLVALDSQGREYAPKPGTTTDVDKGNGPVMDYTLTVPLSRIRKFLVEMRPYYYRDFYGIARQPISAAQHASPMPLAPMPLALVPSSSIPVPPTTSMTEMQKERLASAANLHEIGLALMKYIADHHYRFPDAAHWMDQIIPYLVPSTVTGTARQQRIAAVFHDPASPPSQLWSYSFNRALSSLSLGQIDNPNMIVAVFESSQGVRNASDGGRSVPQPGRHFGGNDFLFADGHTKFLRAADTPSLIAKLNPSVIDSSGNLTHLTPLQNTTGWFAPVNPDARQKIPIQGQVFDRRTMKPLSSTFVIFSQSPKKITVGSVWPSSFTNKAGRFQSILYPGKNYLMVLENDRFRLVGKTLRCEANGNKGSVFTLGTKVGPLRSAQSNYILRWSLPQGYGLGASSSPDKKTGASTTAFTPIDYTTSRRDSIQDSPMPGT